MSREKLINEQQLGVCGTYVSSFQDLVQEGRMNEQFSIHLMDCIACGLAIDHVVEHDAALVAKIQRAIDGGLTPGQKERNDAKGNIAGGCFIFAVIAVIAAIIVYCNWPK